MFGGAFPGGMQAGMPEIRVFHGGVPGGFNMHAQMFHGMHHQRPEPIQCNIELTLEQAYEGCVYPLTFERWLINNNVRSTERETININIPAGLDNNDTIILNDRGNVINDAIRSEVKVTIQVTNNTEFRRNGLDLIYSKKISLKEALCGFTFEILHLNGKRMAINNLNNPNIIKPNYKKMVPNLGMKKESGVGNLIIEFEIEFPEKLTPEQIEGLSGIL
jgi:DnaJ-class molecular chaperone